MITKKYVKSRNVVKVSFEVGPHQLPETVDVESVAVAGDFNRWNPANTPLRYSKKKKTYWAKVELPPNQRFAFRYVANSRYWFNEWQADDYVPNGYGTHNCIVDTARA